MSNSRNLANLLGTSAQITIGNIATSVPLGVEGYSTMSVLPLTGNNIGDQAFVAETNRLYIWNGVGWYNIALINTNPTIDSNSYDAAYTLDSVNGTSTVIQLVASDPEGIPIQWSYTASDSAQYFANITNDSSVFTITAKSNDSIWNYDSTGGTFSVTFKASDGVNLATALSEFTILFATPGYGWFGGGSTPGKVSTVDRINYASDTGTASVRGPLSAAKYSPAATGNDNFGWFAGGVATPTAISTVDRIDYANDGVTASVRGPLVNTKDRAGATGNNNYGWVAGGEGAPTSGGFGPFSIVDRIDYAVDTNTASIRGPLTIVRYGATGTTGNDNYGWVTGGIPTNTSVDRIDYAADTTIASVRGPVNIARANVSATGNANYGWFAHAGNSNIDRINYAADTGIASARGTMILPVIGSAATGDVDYGWFAGGYNGGAISTVDRIDYAADTGTATARGVISTARFYYTATGGYPG